MTQRDKTTVLYVFGGLACAAALLFVVYQYYLTPLKKYNAQIEQLDEDIDKSDKVVRKLKEDTAKLRNYFRYLSMPRVPDKAATEYAKYLKPLLRESGLTVDDFQGPPPVETKPAAAGAAPGAAKKALHQPLTFKVTAKGSLDSLVTALAKIQATPLAHRVKNLIIDRLDAKDPKAKLRVQMTIETLIVNKADPRDSFLSPDTRLLFLDAWAGLHGGPTGIALVPWAAGPFGPRGGELLAMKDVERHYDTIPRRNIFLGYTAPPPIAPPPTVEDSIDPFDMRGQIRLVFTDALNQEAFLRNYAIKMPEMRLRPKVGFDVFKIMNEDRTRVLVEAKVLRVDQRDVYILVKDDIYGVHIGQTLADAMLRPLADGELEALDLMKFLPKEEKTREPENKEKKPKL